jgi:threonine dehydrogenase-like Zn-dependent dehydrogenase
VKEVPYPNPKPGELVIRVEQVGICGTDFHIYEGEFLSPYPIIPGHEFSGTIYELGEGVEGISIGDRVMADPSLFCGRCVYFLTNRGNQCTHWGALGNTVNGSMAEFVAVPARNVVIIPDTMSFATAAFIEPIACVVHAMNRLQ